MFFWIAFHSTAAQPVLFGLVLDAGSRAPVSNAVVVLTGTLHGSLTGSDGRFEFMVENQGEFTVTVSAEGYLFYQKLITVENDSNLEILLIPKSYDLPDHHPFPGSNIGFASRMFRETLPHRTNALRMKLSLYESELPPGSIYLDGVRLIAPYTPLLAIVEMKRTEVNPGPYELRTGMDASIHHHSSDQLSTGSELIYDSRKGGVRSGVTLHRSGARVTGLIRGTYETAKDYVDGGGIRQPAGLRSGNIAGRMRINIATGHVVTGHAGWLQDRMSTGRQVRQQAAIAQYRFTRDTGFLQQVTATAAFQGIHSEMDREQYSGSVSARFAPRPNIRLNMGVQTYRTMIQYGNSSSSMIDYSVFATTLHRTSRLLLEGQFRLQLQQPQWAGAALATWFASDQWRLLAGLGRVRSDRKSGALRQLDLGVQWKGLARSMELMTFTRKTESIHSIGLTAFVRDSWWGASFYTAVSDLQPRIQESSSKRKGSTRVRMYAQVSDPFNLLTLRSEVYGILSPPSWISSDLWIQSRNLGGLSMRIGISNVFDKTYRYPFSSYTEPGRSFQLALRYQQR